MLCFHKFDDTSKFFLCCFLDVDIEFFLSEIHVEKADFTQPDWEQNVEKFAISHFRFHNKFQSHFYGGPYDIAIVMLRDLIDLSDLQNALLDPCPVEGFLEGHFEHGTAIGLG